MAYVKATAILPEELISEIQKYVQGETIYIPKLEDSYQKWGMRSGSRKKLDKRNAAIKLAFKNGRTIEQLADEYYLSPETIKKIVYTK
ncbi:CD3324 family protein [Neobacillus mesonae]|uniref:CD3324 family protein n=1 Tax=Neobacillus mesonae TaxID=1193713 RepID=UPI0025732B07|nr:CD3324 family protein [Neobacillus mesonae]